MRPIKISKFRRAIPPTLAFTLSQCGTAFRCLTARQKLRTLLTATNKVTDIYYSIGDPDVFSSPYLYTLAPSCNLTPTLTVTNLPTLATHNTVTTNFKVSSTTNLALIGSYVVTMTSSITFMKDYLKNLNTLTTSYTFTIYMTPCVIT